MDLASGTELERLTRAVSQAGITTRGLTENATQVLKRRYLAKDREGNVTESPLEMFRRVALDLSEPELEYGPDGEKGRQEIEEEFYRVMMRLEFLPNSPTLMNAGRELQQLSACFVLPIEDTLEGIFGTLKQTALIHQSGGGTGFSFSRLRPAGDVVGSTGGVASGPVSFIGAFDAATEVVKQGSTRRGANMAILNVNHPDILEFIRVKREPGRLTNFNISVAVTQEFMEKVKSREEYDLINPRTGETTGQLNAREVFDEIVESAWATGDPGLVFLDRINDSNPNPQLGKIESTNPCVTGDTLIYTRDGLRRARDLYEKQVPCWITVDGRMGDGGFKPASPVFHSGQKRVHRLRTQEGYEVRLTTDHRVMTNDGWVAAEDLKPGQEIYILDQSGGFGQEGSEEIGQLLGWLIGDGTLKKDMAVLSFFGRKRELAPAFAGMMNQVVPEPAGPRRNYHIGIMELEARDESRVSSSRFLRISAEYGLLPGNKHIVPERVLTGSREMQVGFLRGLFSADGHVDQPSKQGVGVHLTSISRQMMIDVQRLLINFGIACRIYFDRRPAGVKELPDGRGGAKEYNTKAYHELVISKDNLPIFRDEIGFLDEHKTQLLQEGLDYYREFPRREKFTARFKELAPDGIEEVFDLTEPATHSFIANGIVVSNCGEQQLLPYESCNLGSVNLARMLKNDTTGVEIDCEKLAKTIRTGVRMLDNVIDVNRAPIPEIEKMSQKTRRIGLGVMGWAEMLMQLGVRYDSEEALKVASRVMGFVQEETHKASSELARERGSFPEWENSIYKDKEPMRNSAPVTIAPTGTISIIAGTTSGIEPLFAPSYVRNVMDGTKLVEVNPFFEAVARHEGFHSQELMEKVAEAGSLGELEVPGWVKEIFRTSHEIEPKWHVLMQAAFQAYTDNSVSKTINMPQDATREDVQKAYMMAYLTNCNGITVYRDGSKVEQVLSTGGSRPKADPAVTGPRTAPLERPRAMNGITERFRTGHGNMYVTLNFGETGEPFEIFAVLGKAGGCDSAQLEAVSRLASLALRSNVNPQEIIYNLQGITCCPAWDNGTQIQSAPDAMAHMLQRHWEKTDGTEGKQEPKNGAGVYGRVRCPDCNGPIEFREGCETCWTPGCGWTRCH